MVAVFSSPFDGVGLDEIHAYTKEKDARKSVGITKHKW